MYVLKVFGCSQMRGGAHDVGQQRCFCYVIGWWVGVSSEKQRQYVFLFLTTTVVVVFPGVCAANNNEKGGAKIVQYSQSPNVHQGVARQTTYYCDCASY